MISIKELNTKNDVTNLSDEEMYYIDKQTRHSDFNNDEVASQFALEWVARGIIA